MKEDTTSAARAGPDSGAAGRQVNQYDKILRENMEAFLPGLIKSLLDIHAVYTEELPDDVQHTKERKPDVLKKVTDNGGIPLYYISNSSQLMSRKWYSGWRSTILCC